MSSIVQDRSFICAALGSVVACVGSVVSLSAQSCNEKAIIGGVVGFAGAVFTCASYLAASATARTRILRFTAVASCLISAVSLSLYVASASELYECLHNGTINIIEERIKSYSVMNYGSCMIMQGVAVAFLFLAGVTSFVGYFNRERWYFMYYVG